MKVKRLIMIVVGFLVISSLFSIRSMANAASSTTSKVDKTAPIILRIRGNPTNWTNKNAYLEVYAADSSSGVKSITVNGSNTRIISVSGNRKVIGKITITKNGKYKVVVTDFSGNSVSKVINMNRIDKTQPNISISANTSGWTKDDIIWTIATVDSGSGLKSVKVNGKSIALGKAIYRITKNGIYMVIAEDRAGNIVTKRVMVTRIDKVVPTLIVTGNPSKPTTNAKLTIKASDDASKVKYVAVNGEKISLDNGIATYNLIKNGMYKIAAVDNAKNANIQTINVTNVKVSADGTVKNASGDGYSKIYQKGNLKYRLYEQWTGSYSTKIYGPDSKGNNLNIKQYGCGPSCIAIINSPYDSTITPAKVVDSCAMYTAQYGIGTWTAVEKYVNYYGFKYKKCGKAGTVINSSAQKEIINHLKDGNTVILEVAKGSTVKTDSGSYSYTEDTHYITLLGIDSNNKIFVCDPGSSYTDSYTTMNNLVKYGKPAEYMLIYTK